MSAELTIVVPTRNSNREKRSSLAYTLRALSRCTQVDFEVIIANDGGSSIPREAAKSYLEDRPLRIADVPPPNKNVGKARNTGARLAQAPKLLFLDDDTLPRNQDALRIVVDQLDANGFCCGAHRYWTSIYWHKHVSLDQPVESVLNTLGDLALLPRGINRTNGFRDLNEFSFIGNFGGLRKDIFDAVGGFAEDYPGWGMEDTDLMMRLCLAGHEYSLLYEHGVQVLHLTHPAPVQTEYLANLKLFNKKELERRFFFHINHFFRVYEGDGYSLLTPLTDAD